MGQPLPPLPPEPPEPLVLGGEVQISPPLFPGTHVQLPEGDGTGLLPLEQPNSPDGDWEQSGLKQVCEPSEFVVQFQPLVPVPPLPPLPVAVPGPLSQVSCPVTSSAWQTHGPDPPASLP